MNLKLVRDNAARALDKDGGTTPHEEITKQVIDRLSKKPPSGKDEYIQDSELPGFRLRKTPAGTILFLFVGRIRGGEGANKQKLVKRSIGFARGKGAISVAKARAAASAMRDGLAKGIDPSDELQAKAESAEAAKQKRIRDEEYKQWTPAYALEHMIEWRQSRADVSLHLKPATIKLYRAGIGYVGKLARVPIVDLRADDIRVALDKVGGIAKPKKARSALSGVITHAIKRLELNITNPVKNLDRGEFRAPPPRDTYIKEADLPNFIAKVLAINIPGKARESQRARDYVLLTLLYGTRKLELLQMQWSWIDWNEGVITIPASVTKQKKVHFLPLTDWPRTILEARLEKRKPENPYVFPGDVEGKPLTNIRRSLASAVGSDFKLHDARRTLITHCASLGIHGGRLKAIVGHARNGVTENYDQREIQQVRRDLNTYHEWLSELCAFDKAAKADPEYWKPDPTSNEPPKQWPGTEQ